MSEATVDVRALLSAAVDLARRAGDVIRNVRASGSLDVHQKGVDDPVTRADFEAQRLIIGGIRQAWPQLSVVGEETVEPDPSVPAGRHDLVAEGVVPESLRSVPVTELTLFVDPLDATREYTHGNSEPVMVLIGLARNGVPIAGVTHQPFVAGDVAGVDGRTIVGVVGGKTVGIVPKVRHGFPGDIAVVASRSVAKETMDRACAKVGAKEAKIVGGCSLKMLRVLEGEADVYIQPCKGTKLWDTCAAHAFIRAAGGRVTSSKGAEIVYTTSANVSNDDGIIVTMEHHDHYVSALNKP